MAEFPISLDSLVTKVRQALEEADTIDTLAAAISTTSQATLTPTTPQLWGKGTIAEIDDELVSAKADPDGSVVSIARGFKNTTPATHTNGTTYRVNPRYTANNIKDAINVVIGDWMSFYAPRLVWDTTTAGTWQATKDIYEAPADAINVVKVGWKQPGRTSFLEVEHGPLEPYDSTLCPTTGIGFQVFDHGLYGSTVRALFEKPWPFLTTGTDTVPSDFPAMFDYLIKDGAVLYLLDWRLVPRFRSDEVMFAREANEQLPPNFSMAAMQTMMQNWRSGMHRMMSMRAQPTKPRRVRRD